MHVKNIVLILMGLCLSASCNSSTPGALPDDFDEYIRGMMEEHKLPGLAVAVVRDDAVVYSRGFGVRKLGESDPVNEHTLFQAASITKTFTAALMGMLKDQGKIAWDDPVNKYIGDFRLMDDFVTDKLTIRDVLAMRTGIVDGDGLKARDKKELIPLLSSRPLSDAFRIEQTSWNLSYTLAGYLEEIIYGGPWEEIIRDMIFVPLGLTETFTDNDSGLRSTENIATPHLVRNREIVSADWADFGVYAPADCLVTNVSDLSKWLRFLLNRGTIENNSLLESKTLDELWRPQMIVGEFFENIFNPGTNFMTFGLGWFVSDYRGFKVMEMGGSAPGTSTLLALIPSKGIGLAIQTNLNFAFDALVGMKFRIFDSFLRKVSH